ncbi:MAG: 1-acyl-sn-glycerol-3-phosphate acyltransferase [Sphaerochaetaceae bacterium]|nr:1-acyl-sn-glycerol-3-phosphate acyltransferase [Sphaerochaetaceae bacterium]
MDGKFPPFVRLIRHTWSHWLLWHFKVSLKTEPEVDLNAGPFILFSNHCGTYDPLIISSVLPVHIRWITGAYLFKTRFLRFLFEKLIGCIPKQQGQSDFDTVRKIMRCLKARDNVGIFPEGTRTWDGNMVPYNAKVLAKMLRMFKVPAVFCSLEGCFASQPRWADSHRKGMGICVHLTHMISLEEITTLPVSEIQQRISDYLDFSNDRWKSENPYRITSQHRAEGIQRMFYMCPVCHRIGSVVSAGNSVKCSTCGAKAQITETDDIKSENIEFTSMSQWHEWEASEMSSGICFKKEHGVLLQTGNSDDTGRLKTLSKNFTAKLQHRTLCIRYRRTVMVLPFKKITSFVINAKFTMEFFCGDVLYRMRLDRNLSPLKYQEYYFAFKAEKGEK